MENREISRGEFLKNQLPKSMSEWWIPKDHCPTLDDWRELQGGKPELVPYIKDKSGKVLSYNMFHNYENVKDPSGTGVVVLTSLMVAEKWDKGNFYIQKGMHGRDVWFPVACVWSCHGKPCEEKSISMGGEPYPRIPVKAA